MWPRRLAIESVAPRRNLAAVAPRATMISGRTTEICRIRNGPQVSHSSRSGARFLRRAALHHVADVNVFAANAHGRDHVVEQLSGAAHKGLALRVFVRARTLAHEHDARVRIAHAEDDVGASLAQLAAGAVANVFANHAQRGGLVARGCAASCAASAAASRRQSLHRERFRRRASSPIAASSSRTIVCPKLTPSGTSRR